MRAQRPGLLVRLAVVRRRVHVEQVVLGRARAAALLPPSTCARAAGRRTAAAAGGPDEPRARPVERRLDGRVVLGAQAIADVAKRRQLVPAGSNVARAGHSVALARRLRQLVHRLQTDAQHSRTFLPATSEAVHTHCGAQPRVHARSVNCFQ